MMYQKLQFQKPDSRPFIYSDFVQTLDGKVFVKKDGYWPIGSKTDFETFTFLRAHADVIIDGAGTALQFGKNSIETFNSKEFQNLRHQAGKTSPLEYIIISKNPDETLKQKLENPYGFSPTFFQKSLPELIEYLHEKRYEHVFINGGPTLLASFLKEKLLDELFLTISPRIFGSEEEKTLSLVEGQLFDPKEISAELMSIQQIENEVFLRCKILYK